MIRILHIIATLDKAGAEGQLTRLCLRLDPSRFKPAVCCLTRGGPYATDHMAARVPVHILGKRGHFDVAVLGKLLKVIRSFRPHIIHTWLFTSNMWGRAAGLLAGVPVIIASERAADIWKGWPHRTADRVLAFASDAIVANCEAVKNFCVRGIGLPRGKVHVIRNGLNIPLFDDAAEKPPTLALPERHAKTLIGVVGRLEPQKGMPVLLDAMKLLRESGADVELWIIGDGPDREKLEGLCQSSEKLREGVRFLGLRPDVPAILRRLDIFVLPSLWEGLPNAIMEAMAARLPVVATAVDGVPELVLDGETGLLVPPRAPEALAEAITKLAEDSSLRGKMGGAGRDRIEREFSEETMVAETKSLYLRLAREKNLT